LAVWESDRFDPLQAGSLTYQVGIEDGSYAYKTFRDKADGCVKVVIRTNHS